jgi:hypothetical protein
MPPTDTPPAPDPRRPDTSAFLEQQAAILLDAPDNDTIVRRLLAAPLWRISALEQQLAAAAPPGRPRPQPSLRPAILTLLREQPTGLTRPQIEEALARRGLGDTLQRMVRDAVLVRTGDRYRLAHAAHGGQAEAEAAPRPAPVAQASAPPPAPRKRGGGPRTRGRA